MDNRKRAEKEMRVPKELLAMRDSFMKDRQALAHRVDAKFIKNLMTRKEDLPQLCLSLPKWVSPFASNHEILRDWLWPEIRTRELRKNPLIIVSHTPPFIPKPDGHDHGICDKKVAAYLQGLNEYPPDGWPPDTREEEKQYCTYFSTSQNGGTIEAGLAMGRYSLYGYSPLHEFLTYDMPNGKKCTVNASSRVTWIYDLFKVDPIEKSRLATVDAYIQIPESKVDLSGSFAMVKGEVSLIVYCPKRVPQSTPFVFCIGAITQGYPQFITNQAQSMLTSSSVLLPQTSWIAVSIEIRLTTVLEGKNSDISFADDGLASIDLTTFLPSSYGQGFPRHSRILRFNTPSGPIRVEKIECELSEPF